MPQSPSLCTQAATHNHRQARAFTPVRVTWRRLADAARSCSCDHPARGESLALRDSASLSNTATTYSPLFVRSFARNHRLRITSKGIKRRATERFESAHKKPKLAPRKSLASMAQVLSPGQVIEAPVAKKEDDEWRENLNVRMICPDCREDPPDLYEDHASGDMICTSCGLVLSQRNIDVSSEWRTFSNDDQGNDDPSRVGDGPNALLNGAQLNTGIAFGDGMRSKDLHRAQNKSNTDKTNKTLLVAYKQIGALCDGWQLPNSVSDTTKHMFKDASESGYFKGKTQEALIAGCLFLACRRNSVPRTFREVTDLTKVSKKEIGRIFKNLEEFFRKKDKERANGDGTAMIGGGKLFRFLYIDSLDTKPVLSRHRCYPRSIHWLQPGRSERFVQPLLQFARYVPTHYQHRHSPCVQAQGNWWSGWSLSSVRCSCCHFHGRPPDERTQVRERDLWRCQGQRLYHPSSLQTSLRGQGHSHRSGDCQQRRQRRQVAQARVVCKAQCFDCLSSSCDADKCSSWMKCPERLTANEGDSSSPHPQRSVLCSIFEHTF